MTWIAILWLGIGLADLVGDLTAARRRLWATLTGASAQVLVGALTLPLTIADAVAVALCVAALAGWRWWHRTPPASTRDALAGLLILLGATLAAVGLSGLCPPATGPAASWLSSLPVLGLAHVPPGQALAMLGALLLNLTTGNLVVRDVLLASGVSPAAQGPQPGASLLTQPRLRGGRVLGPMERMLILGFGTVGNLAAASLVVAAKGLVRFPELSAASKTDKAPRIDEVTEYFLIGSFASILLALATLALTR